MDEPTENREREFPRPWEDEEELELFRLSDEDTEGDGDAAISDEAEPAEEGDVDLSDYEAMAFNPGDLDEYSSRDYVEAITQEYQGLAEEVSRAAAEQWEKQAVAATLPGVDSGLIGFEDVTGAAATREEDVEATEQAATSDLAMRVGSAVVIAGLFLGSLLLGGWWFTGFIVLIMVVGVGELYATLRGHGYRPLALFGLVGVAAMGIGADMSGVTSIASWAAWVSLATVLFLSLTARRHPLRDAGVTVTGMAWVGLIAFAVSIADGPQPVAYILFLVLVVAANDIGAYFVGRGFGRRPLAPVISPKKTVEGLFGGLIAGLVVSSFLVTFPAWETIGLARGLVTAGVLGVVAPIGDAVESMVKRALGVKDMGSVLPGHGGVLDRIDGFILAAPALYYLFRGFGLL